MGPSHVIRDEGWHWVESRNVCARSRDSIWLGLDTLPSLNLKPLDSLCLGDSLLIHALSPYHPQYLWNDGLNTPHRYIKQAGWHWIEALNTCGSVRDSIWLKRLNKPDILLPNDTIICTGDSLELDILAHPATQYVWQDSFRLLKRHIKQPGIYWLAGRNSCGANRDSLFLELEEFNDFFLGKDTIMCLGDSIQLSLPASLPGKIVWQDGSNDFSHIARDTGLYWVQIFRNACQKADSLEIGLLPYPWIDLGKDTFLCEGTSFQLHAHVSQATFLWNTGSIQPFIPVTDGGHYSISSSNLCGIDEDSIWVKGISIPVADLGKDALLCKGDSLSLKSIFPDATYLWQDLSTDSIFVAREEGKYMLTISNQCGWDEDEINLSLVEIPFLTLGNDTTLCWDEILILNKYSPTSQYLWQDGSDQPHYTIQHPGSYILELQHLCGIVSDTLDVSYQHCECQVYIANAFSPNQDGHNDVFGPLNFCSFEAYQFQIFNRWGQLIFESSDPGQKWDGRYQREHVPEGVYVWRLKYKSDLHKNSVIQRGSVTLIR